MAEPRVMAMVLAGGEGKRLHPLTADRAKPAVPFGGHYRLIDFALSNLANAGFLRIVVLTQYKSHSLDLHISRTWRLSTLLSDYVTPVPAQMRLGPRWFAGSADAIYQNLNLVRDEKPDYIMVFGADHIYRMDPGQMLDQHRKSGAGVTVAAIRVPVVGASEFGVLEPDVDNRIQRFREKPAPGELPPELPDAPGQVLASMGNYVFTTSTLLDAVRADAADEDSAHDVGGSLIPRLVEAGEAYVWDFAGNDVPGSTARDRSYWRDVGTLDSYYEAHMDLVSIHPVFNLYNQEWPIHTLGPTLPPAKFVLEGDAGIGVAINSMVCSGAIVSGGTVRRSVISPGVRIEPRALVENSVLMHNVVVGAGAVVRNSIIDKNVHVPPGTGVNAGDIDERDRFTVSDRGVVVIGKGHRIE